MKIIKGLSEIINQLDEVAIMFYQQKTTEAYKKFSISIDLLSEVVTEINSFKNHNDMYQVNANCLLNRLVSAVQALEAKDDILLADILYYDINPQLQKTREYLEILDD